MTSRITRRRALAGLGSVTLGSLLAACGNDEPAPTTTEVPTTTGGTATVEPKTSTAIDAAQLLDEANACTLTAEQTEGPYYFDAESCAPIESAVVDLWHCDAGGAYSGFEQGGSEEGERFLRDAQATNADGIAEFRTVYPGWYQGRTVHIHAKVHLDRQTVPTLSERSGSVLGAVSLDVRRA